MAKVKTKRVLPTANREWYRVVPTAVSPLTVWAM